MSRQRYLQDAFNLCCMHSCIMVRAHAKCHTTGTRVWLDVYPMQHSVAAICTGASASCCKRQITTCCMCCNKQQIINCMWCSRMTAEYVYFSVVIFIALMLILIVIINFQWAASFFTFLLLLAMLIYGIIGTVFLLLAMVGHDE